MKFTIRKYTPFKIDVTTKADAAGDLLIEFDGVPHYYISGETGKLNKMVVDPANQIDGIEYRDVDGTPR